MTENEKIKEGIDSIFDFFESIPGEPDIYKQILLEELFRIIVGEKTPILFSSASSSYPQSSDQIPL